MAASQWAKTQYQAIKRIGVSEKTPSPTGFIDAFKGVGAYYTMQNMILHHNCTFLDKTKDESILILKSYVSASPKQGWEMLGILKKLIKDNNINIAEKRKEWRIARQIKRLASADKNR